MYRVLKVNRRLLNGIPLLLLILAVAVGLSLTGGEDAVRASAESGSDTYIKWVDFDIPYTALDLSLIHISHSRRGRHRRGMYRAYGTAGRTYQKQGVYQE